MSISRLTIIVLVISIGAALASCQGSEAKAEGQVTDKQPVPEQAFDADSAYCYVERQVSFGPRVPGTEGHKACAEWLASTLKANGADTVICQRATLTGSRGQQMPIVNILGQFRPSEPRRVLLLAHWDTRPWADEDPNPENRSKPLPGANDGASGVGALLEVARQLGINAPAIGVDILFVDAEDSGETGGAESSWCLGTQYWVENMPYKPGQEPRYAILLDMVGGKGAKFHREQFSDYANGNLVSKVWAAAHKAGFGDIFLNEPGNPVLDDHVFLIRAGIPAIDIIENRNPTTLTFPRSWHTMADDMSSISPATLKAAGQTVLNVIYSEK